MPFIVLIFPTLFVTTSLVPVEVIVIDPVPPPRVSGAGQVLACINPALLVRTNVFVLSALIVISFVTTLIV